MLVQMEWLYPARPKCSIVSGESKKISLESRTRCWKWRLHTRDALYSAVYRLPTATVQSTGWHRFCPIRNPLDGSNVSIIIVGQGILDKDLPLLSLTFVGAGAQAQETAVFIMRTAPWNSEVDIFGDSTFVVLSFMPRMGIRGSVTVLSVITCPMSTLSRHPPAASRLFSASHWTTLRRAAACHWSDHRRRRRGRAGDRELDSCREVVRLTGEDSDTLQKLSRFLYIKWQV